MNELIKKLKDKTYVRAFGLMTPEEQECLKKVGKDNCLIFTANSNWKAGNWLCLEFSRGLTYAIKPDYQPEPEFVDLEIVEDDGRLGVYQPESGQFIPLHCLPSRTGFEKFWWEDVSYMPTTNVATRISKGHKVYARLRK